MLENLLYIVPVPIGNLDDITLRAIKILKEVDVLACEDTRHSSKLLALLDIKVKRLIAYHNFNEKGSASGIASLIENGNSVALVSDAGYPCVSDPGYRVVRECIDRAVKIVALPGPSSILPALASSGLGTDSFTFLGFPPQKKGRKTFIENAMNQQTTTILFESSHRIEKLVEKINEIDPKRQLCLAKEISKINEKYFYGRALDILEKLKEKDAKKGEFTIIIERIK